MANSLLYYNVLHCPLGLYFLCVYSDCQDTVLLEGIQVNLNLLSRTQLSLN